MSVKRRRATLFVEELEHRVLLDGPDDQVAGALFPVPVSQVEDEPNDSFETAQHLNGWEKRLTATSESHPSSSAEHIYRVDGSLKSDPDVFQVTLKLPGRVIISLRRATADPISFELFSGTRELIDKVDGSAKRLTIERDRTGIVEAGDTYFISVRRTEVSDLSMPLDYDIIWTSYVTVNDGDVVQIIPPDTVQGGGVQIIHAVPVNGGGGVQNIAADIVGGGVQIIPLEFTEAGTPVLAQEVTLSATDGLWSFIGPTGEPAYVEVVGPGEATIVFDGPMADRSNIRQLHVKGAARNTSVILTGKDLIVESLIVDGRSARAINIDAEIVNGSIELRSVKHINVNDVVSTLNLHSTRMRDLSMASLFGHVSLASARNVTADRATNATITLSTVRHLVIHGTMDSTSVYASKSLGVHIQGDAWNTTLSSLHITELLVDGDFTGTIDSYGVRRVKRIVMGGVADASISLNGRVRSFRVGYDTNGVQIGSADLRGRLVANRRIGELLVTGLITADMYVGGRGISIRRLVAQAGIVGSTVRTEGAIRSLAIGISGMGSETLVSEVKFDIGTYLGTLRIPRMDLMDDTVELSPNRVVIR